VNEVGAAIVAYRSGDELQRCVESLAADGIVEIVVVDNALLEPGSFERVLGNVRVQWCSLGRNVGYGAAMNFAVSKLTSEFVLVVNPDVTVHPGATRAMRAQLDESEVMVVGPKVVNPDGSRYPSFREIPPLWVSAIHAALGLLWPANPVSRRYRGDDLDPASSLDVSWLSGACMMLRRRDYVNLGGFDPRYFLYLEDVDICRRVGLSNGKVRFEPTALVTHAQGSSSKQLPIRSLAAHSRSIVQYASVSHLPLWQVAPIAMGAGVRFLAGVARALVKTGLTSTDAH
jgi:N-acetylglucosaminyl-diphospho-decaprenol L-rhamnosyltransferase